MFRTRGEEIWCDDEHLANVRRSGDEDQRFVVQALDGRILHEAKTQRMAETWIRVHAATLLSRVG